MQISYRLSLLPPRRIPERGIFYAASTITVSWDARNDLYSLDPTELDYFVRIYSQLPENQTTETFWSAWLEVDYLVGRCRWTPGPV